MTKIEAINALNAAGYTLIPLCSLTKAHEHEGKPCKTPGKVPLEKNWTKTPQGRFNADNLYENYGVALTERDCVIDVDPRNFNPPTDLPLKRLLSTCGVKISTLVVRTGGGGLHAYLRIPANVRIVAALRGYPGVEFKSIGRQVVGPGCGHASGSTYEIVAGSIDQIQEIPRPLLGVLEQKTHEGFSGKGTGNYQDDEGAQSRFRDFLALEEGAVTGARGDERTFKVACRGRDLGLSPGITFELLSRHWNAKCKPPWPAEELQAKVAHAYKYAQGAVGSAHPAADFDAILDEKQAGGEKAKDVTPPWDTTAQGTVKKTFHNLLMYFQLPEGGIKDVFAYNEFNGRIEFVAPAPWHTAGKLPRLRGVNDEDLKLLKGFMASRHAFEAPIQTLEEAITNVAYHRRFHPVRDYLQGLKWDGQPRLDTWLRDYLGVADNLYTRACARKTLCAAVARVMHPGIKFDHVLLLEGRQDLGKSTVVSILGGPWAADAPIDAHSRDTVDMMQGRWFIELAELEAARRIEEDALKAFITRKTDLARLAFGRMTREFPRQSIFIGTKNPRADGGYLKDEENRRWWPVRCEPDHGDAGGQVDFSGLKKNRDQLFAEACVRWADGKGEKLYMETFELKELAREEAGRRRTEHEWTESISSWIEECDKTKETRKEFLTGRDIFLGALNGNDRQFDRRCQTSIAGVMRDLGWTTGFKRVGGRFFRAYLRNNGLPATVGAAKSAPRASKQPIDILKDLW